MGSYLKKKYLFICTYQKGDILESKIICSEKNIYKRLNCSKFFPAKQCDRNFRF